MFDYKYYKELLELVRLDKKAEEFRLKSQKYRIGDLITYNKKYKKHIEREIRKHELKMIHVDYYYYYSNEVYGKNKMNIVKQLSKVIEEDKKTKLLEKSNEYYNNLPRHIKRIKTIVQDDL